MGGSWKRINMLFYKGEQFLLEIALDYVLLLVETPEQCLFQTISSYKPEIHV